jgi:O-methyltransferase
MWRRGHCGRLRLSADLQQCIGEGKPWVESDPEANAIGPPVHGGHGRPSYSGRVVPAPRQVATRGLALAQHALLSPIARRVKRERLTYLSVAKLRSLERALGQVLAARVAGDVVECGVALGGSGIVLATHMDAGRTFHGYDLFGTIPPPSERDPAEAHERFARISAGEAKGLGAGDEYYGYVDDLLGQVQRSFAKHGVAPAAGRVELHRGLFEDTLRLAAPVALAHVDSDWHDPVACCLERIGERLSPGGMIVVDDYNDYGGCRTACHEYLARRADLRVLRAVPHLVVERIPAG